MHDGTNPCENGGGICTKMKRRLKSAAFSIVILAAVLAATVFGGVHSNGILPASALPSSVGFYAVSYLNIENGDGAELLKSDLDYMKERGLAALLPTDIRSGSLPALGGYVMLFFENCGAFETITDILQQRGMRGVFTADESLCKRMKSSEKFRNALAAGIAEPAGRFSDCEDEVRFCAALTAERMRMFESFGVPCRTFVHVCKKLVCKNLMFDEPCFAALCRGSEDAEKSGSEGITIAVYGNGVNEFGTSYDGITLLNRIVRLPDWTIEEYFSSIAQPPAS